MAKQITLGTVSHGTLRNEDLIETFCDELESLGFTEPNKQLVADAKAWLDVQASDAPPCFKPLRDQDELGDEICGELLDALNDLAPPYTYFGSNEGDGADFGFWPAIDSLEDDARMTDDVIKVDSTPSYIMQVSDHGNVTLYEVTLKEVWGCV